MLEVLTMRSKKKSNIVKNSLLMYCPGKQNDVLGCYEDMSPMLIPWENAITTCQGLGGHLLELQTAAEWKAMAGTFDEVVT